MAQAAADRAWYEGEAGRRQAAQAAVESQQQAEQAERKVLYQDLQAAAVRRQKEAQLLEHRWGLGHPAYPHGHCCVVPMPLSTVVQCCEWDRDPRPPPHTLPLAQHPHPALPTQQMISLRGC